MKRTLYHGRPEDLSGRLEKEIRTYDFLDQLGIDYVRVDHEQADTMEACKEIDAILDTFICKNLFLCNRQKTVFYLLLMPGDKPFKTKELSAQIGSSRLSFGGSEEMERLLDLTPGSVSVLGLLNDKEGKVNLLVDRDLLEAPDFGCHPCVNTSSLRIKTKDLFEKVIPGMGHEPVFVTLVGEA